MNTRKHAHNAGFTLVEILIVVVILGILSAIVIPQFTSASDTAKANALTTQLQTIRSQLELYRVQHNGEYPDLAGDDGWDLLTSKTDASGKVGDTGTFGPYLQKAPRNPMNNLSDVGASLGEDAQGNPTGGASKDVGWVYDKDSGNIQASVKLSDAKQVGLIESDQTGADSGDIETYSSE